MLKNYAMRLNKRTNFAFIVAKCLPSVVQWAELVSGSFCRNFLFHFPLSFFRLFVLSSHNTILFSLIVRLRSSCNWKCCNLHPFISPWHGRRHEQIWKCCNLRRLFHRSMGRRHEQIWKCSGFSVVVCAWSTTRKLRRRLASVGLAQARPNYQK